LSSKNSVTSCDVDVWPGASPDFGALPADWIASWPSRARAVGSARGVAADVVALIARRVEPSELATVTQASSLAVCEIGAILRG